MVSPRTAKLDPVVSEFKSEEDEAAYDAWFREQVEAALASDEPDIPHEAVMARVRATIERKRPALNSIQSSPLAGRWPRKARTEGAPI